MRGSTDCSIVAAAVLMGCEAIGGITDRTLAPSACPPEGCDPDLGCDTTVGRCVPCGAVAADATDAWVDVAGPSWGTGTAQCPLRTVTQGIGALSASTAPEITLHVAAGSYDAESGESFPIVLPARMTLVGAGSSSTTIRGSGAPVNPQGTFDLLRATIVAGSSEGKTRIEGITVQPVATSTATLDVVGIFCEGGNGPTFVVSPAADAPDPSLEVVGVRLGPFHGVGLVASSTSESACNVAVRSSIIEGNQFGVWASGCGVGVAEGAITRGVIVRLGDLAGGGSTIRGHHYGTLLGYGVVLWDCVSHLLVEGNQFTDNDVGVTLGYHSPLDGTDNAFVRFAGNDFTFHGGGALLIGISSIAHEIVGNSFVENVAPAGAAPSAGLAFGAVQSFFYPVARSVRDNVFRDNDIGVRFSSGATIGTERVSDFGTAADPGGNELACNDRDLVVETSTASGGVALPWRGNVWDHDPPTQFEGSASPLGTDVTRLSAVAASVDVAGSSAGPRACP